MKNVMAAATLSKSFKELEEKGWIEKTKQGGLFGGFCCYKFNSAKFSEIYEGFFF
jgi:predicted transcriptional regulator